VKNHAGAALLAALWLAACETPAPLDDATLPARSERGLGDDAAVQARRAEVEAARARERGENLLESFELRVRNEYDDEYGLRLLTRFPIRDPRELSAQRRVRRAETRAALALLDETALRRRAELCLEGVERAVHAEHGLAFEPYASRLRSLLRWNQDWRESGRLSELDAARLDLTSRIRLARREPGPAPPPGGEPAALPSIEPPPAFLDTSPEQVAEAIRRGHPGQEVHRASAAHLQALAKRAETRDRPSLDFIDLSYEAITQQRRDDHEVAAQVAIEIPIGDRRNAQAEQLVALSRAQELDARHLFLQSMAQAQRALLQIDHFERSAARWRELRDLADEAEALTDRWWESRLVGPAGVASLLDRVYSARVAVTDAREDAALSSCALEGATGVALEDWSRLPENPSR
jgi:hypothetical protein